MGKVLLSACAATALLVVPSATGAERAVGVTLRDATLTVGATTIPVGSTVFTILNRAHVARTFTIGGKSTPRIAPGKRATLRVTLATAGSQSYASAGPHGAATLKGSLQVFQPCTSSTASTVNVSLGQDQGGLVLTPSSVPCGAVTFVVTDAGTFADDLLVFADLPSEKGATEMLQPGQTTRLTVTFTARGAAVLESGVFPPAEPEMGGDFTEQGRLAIG